MRNSRFIMQPGTLNWLLEENNPSVRYFTLVDLLDKSESDRDVVKARQDIMQGKVVSKILSRQENEGHWEAPERFYTAKYKGTVWQLIILAEFGADSENENIRKACEFILDKAQERESGGFSFRYGKKGGGTRSTVIPCLTGNMLWSLIRFGYLDDPRVRSGIDWVTTYQRFDDGVKTVPKGWTYDKWDMCWGKHSCFMGVVKSLKALSEIPAGERSEAVRSTIDQGVEFLLMHHIHKRSHDLGRVSKPGWLRFGFPLMYQTDVLEILGILTKLGYRDERMQEAVDLVASKQGLYGRWKLENTFNGRFQTNIEQKGVASKWLTLNALRVLKRFHA
jgi:hypothetical protein